MFYKLATFLSFYYCYWANFMLPILLVNTGRIFYEVYMAAMTRVKN